MKKLTLDLDTLEVESFAPAAPEPEERGSVAAHESGGIGQGTCYYHCTFRGFTCDFGSCGCPPTAECPDLSNVAC